MQYDWSQFRKRIPINASARDIFLAWATPAGLEKWFLRSAQFTSLQQTRRNKYDQIEMGDRYKWRWFGYNDETFEIGEVFYTNHHDSIQFSFCGCLVEIKIIKEHHVTILELVQSNIPVTEEGKTTLHLGCMAGWVFYMANLKSILENGIDLRNKNEVLQDVLNA
ncbi:uncharacterized protein YndB with AHSA1/START domain [Chitinophaga skermanii]|uniref:Uncharacterized protein YndB with AHSA1/START domain n=1 Tax=Chitinophaga skermanii TaxID=331697 RepID=A0A327Q4H3_9BACT|nr:SRPBCC domain-containing protein [Chitinophaga skermanii]RAI98677.1 uncharacterized protein YndB with AHSA1/START domain [Chitinophaga skermanii]